jgi:hypothetical protein
MAGQGWIAEFAVRDQSHPMQQASSSAITDWKAILLAPILIPLAVIAGLLPGGKSVKRTPDEVAGFLRDLIDGDGGEWDWDEFEAVPISDPELDGIRQRAAVAGPPNVDLAAISQLIIETERIALTWDARSA